MGERGRRARRGWHRWALAALVAVGACRVTLDRQATDGGGGAAATAQSPRARGSALYATYCAGCHGADGGGDGPVALVLNLRPTDLRAPALLAGASDAEVIERVRLGAPLSTHPSPSAFTEERQIAALTAYVAALSNHDWPRARAGRLVYDMVCTPCHGAYGTGEGVIGDLLVPPPANLQQSVPRYTERGLAALVRNGVRSMPPMGDMLDAGEVRTIVAYVQLLSPGYRLYDTYCAGCHGDDGHGVHPEDRLAPAVVAPAIDPASLARLSPAERQARILHMFRREQGLMPHFQDIVSDRELRDIVVYLRSLAPAG